jgi:16S rRNA (guanine966-N2)-methyltransferase
MSIRVIAGSHRSRVLKTPPGLETRPTGARVREALFSILQDVSGLRVLDAFAGSGALGIEALSRGAKHALFIEHDRKALLCIRENLANLGLGARATVLALSIERVPLETLTSDGHVDLVLADPPWAQLENAVEALTGLTAALADEAQLVLEHPRGWSGEIDGFARTDLRKWGDTGASFFVRAT